MGKQWKQWLTLFFWTPKSLQMVTAAMKLKDACSLEEKLWATYQHVENRGITLPKKIHLVKAMFFPVVIYGCESWTIKEIWALKHRCFWTVVLEKTLESPLDWKEMQPVHPKGNQSWIFIGRTNAETETPILCLPDAKNWLIWKELDAGKDWRQEKGMTEDEMAEWHHRLNGHEFKWTLGVGDGQEGLACCSPLGPKKLDMAEQLNWLSLLKD